MAKSNFLLLIVNALFSICQEPAVAPPDIADNHFSISIFSFSANKIKKGVGRLKKRVASPYSLIYSVQ
ncbi:hypothetical protein [uncultured Gammaproteobacteria bacterium]|nr:hypothetical protein [uncultured Gammaproteobacteria bacterium]VVH51578.1 hypothetical protein BPUTSESOX_1738 [uncultured Gammaproteobacteria bacterium]